MLSRGGFPRGGSRAVRLDPLRRPVAARTKKAASREKRPSVTLSCRGSSDRHPDRHIAYAFERGCSCEPARYKDPTDIWKSLDIGSPPFVTLNTGHRMGVRDRPRKGLGCVITPRPSFRRARCPRSSLPAKGLREVLRTFARFHAKKDERETGPGASTERKAGKAEADDGTPVPGRPPPGSPDPRVGVPENVTARKPMTLCLAASLGHSGAQPAHGAMS